MNVLLMSREFPPLQHGGVGSFGHDLATSLVRTGHRVCVMTEACDDGTLSHEQGPAIYTVRRLVPRQYRRWLLLDWLAYSYAVARALPRLLTEWPVDVIEAPSVWGQSCLCRDRRLPPIVVRLHGLMSHRPIDPTLCVDAGSLTPPGRSVARRCASRAYHLATSRAAWALERRALLGARFLIAPSQFMYAHVSRLLRPLPAPAAVIHHGIDPGIAESVPQVASERWCREHLGLQVGERLVLFVGRVGRPKGAHVLLESIPSVIESVSNVRFVFAGPLVEGDLLPRFRSAFGDEASQRAIFTGRWLPRNHILHLYKACDLLVHPTFYDAASMVVLEAMAFGKPVVASNTGPMPELVHDGVTGRLFSPGDSRTLADQIIEVLANDKLRRTMGQNAHSVIRECFGIDLLVRKTLQVYDRVI